MGASENMLMERKWKDEGPRYGSCATSVRRWCSRFQPSMTKRSLKELVERAYHPELHEKVKASRDELGELAELARAFESPRWEERFAALKELGRNTTAQDRFSSAVIIIRANQESKDVDSPFAVVFLGLIKTPDVLAHSVRL